MISIDFSQPGGIPVTQDLLAKMQAGWQRGLSGLVELFGDTAGRGIILSGMVMTEGSDVIDGIAVTTFSMTNGWLLHAGMIFYVTGGSGYRLAAFAVPVPGIQFPGRDPVALPLIYEDTSAPHVLMDVEGAFVMRPNADPAAFFDIAYSDCVRWDVALGEEVRQTGWLTLALSAIDGTIAGTMSYRKNRFTNLLEYRVNFSATTPGDFTAAPGGTLVNPLGTLPVGYRPSGNVDVLLRMDSDGGTFVPMDGGGHMTSQPITIEADGTIYGTFAKPDGGAVTQVNYFGNGVFGLD